MLSDEVLVLIYLYLESSLAYMYISIGSTKYCILVYELLMEWLVECVYVFTVGMHQNSILTGEEEI